MKASLDKLIARIVPIINKLQRYKVIIFFVMLVVIYGFLVFKINSLSNQEPDSNAVTAKLKTVSRPRIDQSAVDKILQLQDNSVQVKALFNKARNNPFRE